MRAVLVALLLLFGCSDSATEPKCVERTEIIEVVWTDLYPEFYAGQVEKLKSEGWVCIDQPIRNAEGTQIGKRYTCTICD